MLYAITAFILLTVPGLCIALLAGIRNTLFLLTVSLSYACFVYVLKLGQITGLNVAEISSIYMAFILLLVVATVVFRVVVPAARSTSVMPSLLNYMSENRAYLSGSAVIAVALAIYYLYAGVYLELPSDVFQHMEYVQTIVRQLEASANYGSSLPGFYLQYNGKYWHYFYALTNHWIGTDVSRSILAASYLNNLFFLLGVFSFALLVFGKMLTNKRNLVLVSLAVVSLSALRCECIFIYTLLRYGSRHAEHGAVFCDHGHCDTLFPER